ncbi:MAG: hypothetical protein IKB20_03425 [Clostridia bacterium]|nr:hypothetical protein [Clostridia bacterium]
MLKIIEVQTKKQRREFVEYPLRLYKGNPYFVPPLYGDERKIFTSKNIYCKTCKSVFFLAERDGVIVGRIQGIIQKDYNRIYQTKQARFTRFDCEENAETAKALFRAVEEWARQLCMEELVGPLGYSDLEREGLLIEGFEYLSTFEEQYNYPYYADLIEGCGYAKDVDWVESRLFASEKVDERMQKLLDHTLKKHNLHIAGEGMGKRAFIKKYGEGIFRCIDECYKGLYGVVPYTPEMQKQMTSQFMMVLNRKYLTVVCDENEEVVAFGVCIPGFGKAIQKSGGKLTPACLVRLLRAIRKPESIDLALVGIMPRYRKTGLSVLFLSVIGGMLAEPSVQYMETNLNLESNTAIQAVWKRFDNVQHKRRRAYKKVL